MRPINVEGRFGGIRVWNTNDTGEITFVADLDFQALRPFARHMLKSLAEPQPGVELELDDPPDPLELLDYIRADKPPKAPRIVDHVWARFLDANGGDRLASQQMVSRILERESRTFE